MAVDGLAEHVRRGRARLGRHAVAAERAELRTVRRQVELGATEVLHERSAALHVDQLQAAADAEHGQAALARAAQQGQLERVAYLALGRRLVRPLLELGAVERGVESGPPVRISPSMPSSTSSGILRAVGRRREQDRHAAGQAHALDVALRDDGRLELPVRPARVRAVGADADAGTAHRRSKERRSSQSVTAASKASSSTVAALR